jgi:lipid-A-disaccharide synthase
MPPVTRRVFMTAAEASGDQHAAELARSLRQLDPGIIIEGIGGAKMAAAGVVVHHESIGRAAMGWRGALRTMEVWRWLRWTRKHFEAHPPDLHISVDSSAMNLPFARLAKKFSRPVMYYIAPQLWASREWRMYKLRKHIDRLACILPFEEEYFRSHGVNATYVGHPLFDELPEDRMKLRCVDPEKFPTIAIIPGSRRSEVQANLPHLIDVASRIRKEFPAARFVIPTTDITHATVEQIAGREMMIVRNGFDAAVASADLCLVKSGTSTLHVAAYHVPMIVVYRLNPVIWHLAGRWIVNTKKIAMVNILAGNIDLVPEFVPWYGSNEPVARCAIELLKDPQRRAEQSRKLAELIAPLDKPGASMNAARLALQMMDEVALGPSPQPSPRVRGEGAT